MEKIDFNEKELEKLIQKSIPQIKKYKGKFCISSKTPHEWNINEEEKWDNDLNYVCIKARINHLIVDKIREKTKKEYSASEGNFRINYDLKNNEFSISIEPLFIFGRYKKMEKGISQTRWMCRNCKGKGCKECEGKGKNYISIEEIVGERFQKEFKCKDYFLHASGREDVDVINTAGRPFVFQLIEPENVEGDLEKVKKELEKDGRVIVENLKIVNRGFVEMVSNSHFNKGYIAIVELGRKVVNKDLKKIKELEGVELKQKTPTRVKHRRVDKIRKRRILELNILEHKDKEIKVEIITEPGTYIKELINGDENRTKPSFSEVLNTNAKCKELIVSRIDDEFIDALLAFYN